jgi:hypothetical protein
MYGQCNNVHYCLLTFLLTPWSTVLLEKLTGLKLVKKFPAFYGTRRFITAFTSARHLSLPWTSSIHSIPPHTTSWRSILILSSHLHLGLPSGFFHSDFPIYASHLPHPSDMPHPSHYSPFYRTHNIGWAVQIMQLHVMKFSAQSSYLIFPRSYITQRHKNLTY